MSDAPELKPCPFCGSINPYTDEESCRIFGQRTGHAYAIACSSCEVSSNGSETLPAAITAWNTRADTSNALVAAAYEAAAGAVQEELLSDLPDHDGSYRQHPVTRYVVKAIRALTPADAQAALDALVAEKVREALTEAHQRAGRLRGRVIPKRDATDAGEGYDLAIDDAQAVIAALREPKG